MTERPAHEEADETKQRQAAEQVPAEELRRRQQLGQTPGMFVDPPSGRPMEPDTDAAGEPEDH